MLLSKGKHFAVGSKVKVSNSGGIPEHCTFDNDGGRTSGMSKKRLMEQFFMGNKNISGEVMYISRESERESLRRKKLIKIRLRDPAGTMLTITANPAELQTAR